ncbi:hypothetical protein [Paraburkholderia acidipaludis]|uniref:hypothetical protein n=1 Tax=Paraburkholderia acidipaludis TaxID=660537 RepID=UPI00048505ED|nr:hypothetical protein [Paraburkholderia acidipaludis]
MELHRLDGQRRVDSREDKPVARRIKGASKNRVGQVFGCRLLLADKLIQGLCQGRCFASGQSDGTLHLYEDDAIVARPAVYVVDVFSALGAQDKQTGVRR